MNPALGILLVEPDSGRRRRRASAILGEPRLLLAECVACGRRALERVAQVRPDVVLVAAAVAYPCATDFVRRAKASTPRLALVATVGDGEERAALDWLAAGAEGCISDAVSGADLAAGLLLLRSTATLIVPGAARRLFERSRVPERGPTDSDLRPGTLTPRESDVLRLVAKGCTYSAVGDSLGITLNTVASHVKNAYRKLGVRSAAAAVMRAVELRVIEGG